MVSAPATIGLWRLWLIGDPTGSDSATEEAASTENLHRVGFNLDKMREKICTLT